MSNTTENQPTQQPAEKTFSERLHDFWVNRIPPGMYHLIAMLWPFMLFATVIVLTIILACTGAMWALCAFVLPITIILLLAGPKFPPSTDS